MKKRNKGITLIALVITIIVLLILAGVSIAVLTGDNGLLTRVNEADMATTKAGALEKVQVEVMGSIATDGKIDKVALKANLENISGIQGVPETITSLPITVTVDGYDIKINANGNVKNLVIAKPGEIVKENADYTDGVQTAIIPEGFAVVTDPDTIDNGLVISDKPNDDMANTAKGNQFVWVPVNFSEFVRHDFGKQGILDSNFIDTNPTASKYYEPTPDNITGTTSTTAAEVKSMYKSVEENGGFYIARFEAGTTEESGTGIIENIVSKKEVNACNDICWSDVKDDMAVETGGAVEAARGMYPGKSTLCYGVQWDAIMRWISKDDSLKGYLTNSDEKGNYETGVSIKTGSNENYQMKNIYDMAGNVLEWTMEAYNTNRRVFRGGCFFHPASNFPMPMRLDEFQVFESKYANIGFRVALYV